MPNPDRYGINLLRNPDWTEDIGIVRQFYGDARDTPGWFFSLSGANGLIIRNYDCGHQYNFGRGGICHYIPNFGTSEYCYSGQDIPFDGANYPDQQFEVSAYCRVSRANVILYARVLNGAKDTVIQDFTQSYDSGSGSYGDPSIGYVEGNYKRMWVKVDVSANANKTNARWLRILVLSQANQTTGSGLYPFVAWHKAMICRAPPNVTIDTASQWNDGGQSSWLRGLSAPIQTDSSASDYCSIGYSVGAYQYYYHASTDPNVDTVLQCNAGDRILLDVYGWVTSDAGSGTKYNIILTDALISGGSGTLWKDSGYGTGNLEIINNAAFTFTGSSDKFVMTYQRIFTVPTTGSWTFGAMLGLDSASYAGDQYIRFRVSKIVD
jgi:hypothetical protein